MENTENKKANKIKEHKRQKEAKRLKEAKKINDSKAVKGDIDSSKKDNKTTSQTETSSKNKKTKIKDKTKEKKTINWKLHIPLYILEILVLCLVVFGAVVINNATKAEKVNLDLSKVLFNNTQVTDTSADTNQAEAEPSPEEEKVLSPEEIFDTSNDVIVDRDTDAAEEDSIDREAIQKELYERYNGIFNMAFFGVDSREGELGKGSRSDSMIICSIDMNTHEVKLVSIFRDTYLNLGNGAYNKCNSAYAIGGPEQALSMINMNTDLYVDQYVTVGFEGLVDAIDALGGVPINVEENEIFHLNNYQMTMADQLGVEYTPVLFSGTQMLNGLQATAYCRIRYTAGNDFKRAERQRTVIAAMMERAGNVSISSLTAAMTKILPNVSTSLSVNDITNMLSLVGDYEVTASDGFPFEGMRTCATIGSKGSCVIPTDLAGNVKKLHLVLFGEEDYKVSSAVQQYSARVKEDTSGYLQ